MTEMQLYDLRVTVERIEGRSVCGLSFDAAIRVIGEGPKVAGAHFFRVVHVPALALLGHMR